MTVHAAVAMVALVTVHAMVTAVSVYVAVAMVALVTVHAMVTTVAA